MHTRKCFTVINPPIVFWLWVCILCLFITLVVPNTILLPLPHTVMHICITIFAFIPVTFVILWAKMYRTRVNGLRVTVREELDLVKSSFAITDIRNV